MTEYSAAVTLSRALGTCIVDSRARPANIFHHAVHI